MDKIAIYLVFLAGFVTLARSGFIFTFPGTVIENEKTWVCLYFHKMIQANVNISLLLPNETLLKQIEYPNKNEPCFSLYIPFVRKKNPLLNINGKGLNSTNSTVKFGDSYRIKINKNKLMILVQPDKPIYKPGQTVKFRALLFDHHFKPWTGNIDKIYITDPKGTRIVQWLNHHVDGLLSLEMQLSDDPILGNWLINIKTEGQKKGKTFEVKEYVLPKYELTLKLPSHLSFLSKIVDVEICAIYTYGKPVYGKLNGTICISGRYENNLKRPCFIFNEYLTGCKKYIVDSKTLQLKNNTYSLWNVYLNVNATVVEEGTGITETESSELPVKIHNYKLELHPYTKKFFKPGFAQYLNVIVTTSDEKPVPELDMTVEILNQNGTLKKYITDENGMISALIPAQPSTTENIRVTVFPTSNKVKSDEMKSDSSDSDDDVFTSSEIFNLYKWYSLSPSFISIDPIYKKLPCNNKTEVVFYYNYNETQGPMTIFYQVFSLGENMVSNSTDHNHSTLHEETFKEPTLNTAFLNGKNNSVMNDEKSKDQETALNITVIFSNSHVGEKKGFEKPTPIYKQTLSISGQLAHDSSLTIYYIQPEGEIISDSIKIPVENCLPNPVSMKFNKESAKPQNDIKLKVRAASYSLCAVAMVDKSVHILGGNNQITPEKIFEKLSKYNLPRIQKDNWNFCHQDHIGPPSPPGPTLPLVLPLDIPIDLEDVSPEVVENTQKKKKINKKGKAKNRRKKKTKTSGDAIKRQKRSILYNFDPAADASEAFKKSGLAVITDLILESKPCFSHYYPVMARYDAQPGPISLVTGLRFRTKYLKTDDTIGSQSDSEETRSDFPETWLWDIETVGPDGMFTLSKKVPDTITTWVGNAICTNKEVGVGVSEQVNFKVFKPFFVSYTLPYSAVRGEKVPLLISVFNYLTSCLTVDLELVTSEDFVVHQYPNKTSLCVCGEKPETIEYIIIPQELGEININVTAKAVNKKSSCDSKASQLKKKSEDRLSRKLLTTAEGLPREYTYNSFFCLRAEDDSVKVDTVRLELPKNHLVPDSHRASVSVIGDLMGPTLSGLENLVKMPYGCGEQNMVGFVPNIYVMRYLKTINKTDSPLIPSATKYMEKGYQRELQYQHDDGTFSAFGKSDTKGSTWLTAFVLKSFAQAKEFIYIDESIILKIIHWFSNTQLENGCFHEFGKVWSSYLKGGLQGNGDIPLTAYVVIALLEAGVPKEDMIKNAMDCLSKAEVNDTYTLALMRYAFIMTGNEEKKNSLRVELKSRAVLQDGDIYWTRDNKKVESNELDPWLLYGQAPSAEVEITSYIVLGILQDEGVDAVAEILNTIQWLTKQRNPYGGFSSTQDTVLALQALAECAKFTYTDKLDMHIELKGDEFKKAFSLNNLNSLLLMKEEIKKVPNEIKLKAKGAGCALVQMNVKYNIFEMIANTSPLILKVFPDYDERCDRASLSIIVGDLSNSTNMAVSEIKLPTGWVVYRPSLKDLEFSNNGFVKRAEVQNADTQLNVYFEQLSSREQIFSVQVVQNIVLEETKPAAAVLYYYYEKQIRTAHKFNLTTRCGKDKPASGHDKNEKDSVEEIQKRCPVCSNTIPPNFMDIFCESVATYKVSLMNATSKLKIYFNERPNPREIISSVVRFDIDSKCKCDNLKHNRPHSLTIIAKKNLYDAATKSLQLNQWSSIYPHSMTKAIRKKLRTSPCKE